MKLLILTAAVVLNMSPAFANSTVCYKKATAASEMLPQAVCLSEVAGKAVISVDGKAFQPAEVSQSRSEAGKPVREVSLFVKTSGDCSDLATSKLIISLGESSAQVLGVVAATSDSCHSRMTVVETAIYNLN